MARRFEKTIAVLAKAYREGTLTSGNTCMCAVGNMIAQANDYEFGKYGWYDKATSELVPPFWYLLINPRKVTVFRPDMKVEATHQAQSTGYSVDEILRIEAVFEANFRSAELGGSNDPSYDALVAVYELLASVDQIDLSVEAPAELVFVR